MGRFAEVQELSYAYHMARGLYLLKLSQFADFQVPDAELIKYRTNYCPIDQVCD
jgi:hypothetical protein